HYGGVTLADEERPARSIRGVVTANLFDVLGVEALRGRTFLPGEDGPGGTDVVILDHGLWQSRYGGDPQILGSTIRLDGVPHTVTGIMPPDFVFPWNEVKLWTPMRIDAAAEPRGHTGHILVGRLADGWSRESAREELEGIQRELAAAHPDIDGEFAGISVLPLRQALNFAWEAISVGLPILLAAVGFVLLIVCVNVASLTLARNAAREGEVAVRAALGAGRQRLTGQFLTEAGVLALAGGALGILLAFWAVSAVGPMIPEALFRVGGVTLDRTVLAYTATISLATPFLFGLVPAVRAARTDLADTLRSGGRGRAGNRRGQASRRALVVAEVALAIVLVAGAGLMLRSLGEVQERDLGFDVDRLLTVTVQLPENEYPSEGEVAAFFDEATSELEALPGVRGVGAISNLPMNHEMAVRDFAVPGQEPPSQADWPLAAYTRISEGYFDAMGVPVRAGREFREGDGEADDVVIVSETLARRHLGAENPVGASLLIGNRGETERVTIVGVVAEVQQADL
ncbi:MAG: FtsX-like permease family protein, partial [Gemmatimonadetes bacterium]|nr:FtsX-like permease family protein [Gemmatimonadota bacterium]NIR79597.1 FtsX-like permease family protein [Gemmatimonadota bacterium]NIT88127.1 FtsX-like permease family protein [Gemmatimonadota bacterium]NIU32092.1 FtsX-like permease family protein [Gemmatimonadota bacterium]NIU36564.1 FtsX-like permease family protein [Gemmatimonadota bacterium]